MSFNCGSVVIDECDAETRGIEWGSDASFKALVMQAVSMAEVGTTALVGLTA